MSIPGCLLAYPGPAPGLLPGLAVALVLPYTCLVLGLRPWAGLIPGSYAGGIYMHGYVCV